MPNINLLPETLIQSKALARLNTLFKRMGVIVFAILAIWGIIFLAVIILLNYNLRNSKIRQESLKTSIKSLEASEQGLFLIKDRLAKIKSVQEFRTAPVDLASELTVLGQKTPEVSISEIKIESGKTSFLASAVTSTAAGNLLENLLQDTALKRVKLNSFSFNPAAGYSLDLEISK